jgi:hypothetical protein
MAVISASTLSAIPGIGNIAGYKVTFQNLTQTTTDTTSALQIHDFSDKSVQIEGTFGVSGAVNIEGSNDGTNFRTLNDPTGNALQLTQAGMKAIIEPCIQLRAHCISGDASTTLNVSFFLRKTGQL